MSTWWVVVIGAAALVLSGVGGWPLTGAVLRLAARSSDSGEPEASGGATPASPDADPGASAPGHDPNAPAAPSSAAPVPDGSAPTSVPGGTPRPALRGGTWIGILERLAVTATLLAGYPSGIAFVIAVKGLGRYPELRDHPDVSERFVIGTFASMLWAVVLGIAGRVLIGGPPG